MLTIGLVILALAPMRPEPWVGILGTGQSLSVGAEGWPIISKEQKYGNLKLSSGELKWPVDSKDPALKLVPLVEPVGHRAPAYPSSWPQNIDGETPHSAMGNQISALSLSKFKTNLISVHCAIGESGQGIKYLKKGAPHDGVNGRSFESALIATTAMTRMAKAEGRDFAIKGVIMTHGETDCGNYNYGQELVQLLDDYRKEIKAITGQKDDFLMFITQQNSLLSRSPSTLFVWQLGVHHPDQFVCVGPKYQYPYVKDQIHLSSKGYQLLGEKYGQVFFERVVLKRKWSPLQPTKATQKGSQIVLDFHVPVGPLSWDEKFSDIHQNHPQWSKGMGFEVVDGAGPVEIKSVSLGSNGKSVVVECGRVLGHGAKVSYALYEESNKKLIGPERTNHAGALCDSDPFVGEGSRQRQRNYCVAFELELKQS